MFIDTEASGLPKNWNLPYNVKDNWPYSVQVAWVIYTKQGQKIKEENFYIHNHDFTVSKSATKIHGITEEFLHKNGQNREKVMRLFADDVNEYHPLVIGHFMEFDFHILGADFYRSGIEFPVKKEDTFCTMLSTRHLAKNPAVKFLPLGQLHEILFNTSFAHQHNAIEDANATALCFFELIKRGDVNEEIIEQQQKEVLKKGILPKQREWIIPVLIIVLLAILIFIIYDRPH